MNWYVLEYFCWEALHLTILDFNALSIGGGPVAAVVLCIKRGDI